MEDELRELIDDQRFQEYHRKLVTPKGFNTFDVLAYSGYEIRHSNVLAWLLRPGGSHGIGPRFLEWFVGKLNERLAAVNADPLPEASLDASNVAVWRERDHVDITIYFKRERCLIAIENKVVSATAGHAEQAKRYVRQLHATHQDHRVVGVLLTTSPDGSVSFPAVAHVGWDSVRKAIAGMHKSGKFEPRAVDPFIRQYLDLVERWFRPAARDGVMRLLDKHGGTLKELRQILGQDGDNGVGAEVPEDRQEYRDTLVHFVKETRHDPKALRAAVSRHLKSLGCRPQSTHDPSRTHYWLSWGDANLDAIAQTLTGSDETLKWNMAFTRKGVWVRFSLYRRPSKRREEDSPVDRIRRFMRETPINRQQPASYPMKGAGQGWFRVFSEQLLSSEELVEMSAPEVEHEVIKRLDNFMTSDESEYRRILDYLQCLAYTPPP